MPGRHRHTPYNTPPVTAAFLRAPTLRFSTALGMHWPCNGATSILAMRCQQVNNRWEEIWC
jgi:hypothetical protein